MFKVLSTLCVTLVVMSSATYKDNNQVALNYIDIHKGIAISEMSRTGIPASIKLGQAIVETNSGQSALAGMANNHFGLKCKSYWQGGTYYQSDDDYDKHGNKIQSCFRSYDSSNDSYVDHSDFLRLSPNYKSLFKLSPTDYIGWAYGLKNCGYATDIKYSDKLIRVIERYSLTKYDYTNQSHTIDAQVVLKKTNESRPPEPYQIPSGYNMGDFK